MTEIPRMTGMIRMTRMYDWDDYRTELNKMTGKTVVAGTNGMTEMTGITTMTTVYRNWDDQDEWVDWD